MSPKLCIELLDPEQYVTALEPVAFGRDSYTHLALINFEGKTRRWYVKFITDRNDSDGSLPVRGLINEIVGYTLAHHAGLPQSQSALIRVTHSVLRSMHKDLGTALVSGDNACFASLEAHDPSKRNTGMVKLLYRNSADIQKKLLGWTDLPAVMAFDTWVANVDRNTGNLIQVRPGQFAVIDHGRILTGPHWEAADLKSDDDYANRLMDILFDPTKLPLPVKSAILHSARRFLEVYKRAEPELAFWFGSDPDKLEAGNFLQKRGHSAIPLLTNLVGLIA
ncbi:MAG: hypothetical protein NT159_15650 [Proteobacteria bacterium]|nr:hypothetical protein [Pseudomonadota bacterium]